MSDAVGGLGGVAGLDAPGAPGGGLALPRLHAGDEGAVDGPPGHTHRAVDDAHVLGPSPEDGVFIGLGGVALLRGDETGGDLHPGGPQAPEPS